MILGIDLGQKTTGLAISDGQLASPYKTIHHRSISEATLQILRICDELEVKKLIVGFVEGKIKRFFQKFVDNFKKTQPQIEIIMWDETLTTRQAQDLQIKLGIAKSARRSKEHQVAAAIILQSYLDSHD